VPGTSPGEFLGALRLQRAKELLLTMVLRASGVRYKDGYASLGNFTSRLTQLVEVSPGRMRRLTRTQREAVGNVAQFKVVDGNEFGLIQS
jgi:AraC family transcriptional regulator